MRTLKVAIYLLAVLTAIGLSYEANANANIKLLSKETQESHFKVSNKTRALVQKLKRGAEGQRGRGAEELLPPSPLALSPFPDVQNNWARTFVQTLAARNIILGFPDGTFRPDAPVTRAEFATMLTKAFKVQESTLKAKVFNDVPANHWADSAVQKACGMGFLGGYPDGTFNPSQNIPRVQVLVALANGLKLQTIPKDTSTLNTYFQDASQIPGYARNSVAAAIENHIVASYPNVAFLNPNQLATRADVAAFIYQALAMKGEVPPIDAKDAATAYIPARQPVAKPIPPKPQQVAQLGQQLPLPMLLNVVKPTLRGGGGASSLNSPTAFGANWGSAFVGTSFQSKTRYGPRPDGVASFGFGLGNARKSVGLEVAVTVVDLIGETGKDGTVSFKIHRMLPQGFAIALGVENAVTWGSTDGGSSIYGVASKVFRLQDDPTKPLSRLTVSLGLGGDRFRREIDRAKGVESVNVFGSVGLQATRSVSLIADWSGQDLYLGASIIPFPGIPLVITPGFADVTGNAPGDGNRFILGVGYGFSFR